MTGWDVYVIGRIERLIGLHPRTPWLAAVQPQPADRSITKPLAAFAAAYARGIGRN